MKLPISSNKFTTRLLSLFSERKRGLLFLMFNLSGNSLTLLLNFALPIFLSGTGYGTFALLFSFYNLFSAIFTFGLDSSILKFTLEKHADKGVFMRCFYGWIVLCCTSLVVIAPAVAWFSGSGILKVPFSGAIITLFSAFLISYQRIVLSYYIAKSTLRKYGILFVINKLSQVLIFLIPAATFTEKATLSYLPYLFFGQSLLVFLLTIGLEHKEFTFEKTSLKDLKKLIRFTMPLSFETFGNIGYSYGFNLLISPFLTLSQLGTLNIFTQLGNIVSMTSGAFNNGYLPTFFKQLEDAFNKTVRSYFRYILTNIAMITLGVCVAGAVYFSFFVSNPPEYALILLCIYLCGIFLYAFKSIGSSYLIIKSKTSAIATFTILSSLINIGTGMLITRFFGFPGCIVSLASGYLLQSFLFNFEVLKLYIKNNRG